MTTPAQDASLVLPSEAFRPVRLTVICAVLTALAVYGTQHIGRPMLGVFIGVGLFLGLINGLMVRRSAQSATGGRRSKIVLNSATRLLILTVVGLVIAAVFRPAGVGVVFGIAIFEVLLVATTALPVVNKLRNSGADAAVAGAAVAEGTEQ